MTSATDRLWRSAQSTTWSDRPRKSDVEALAPALDAGDTVEGVWRAVWSFTSSSALAVTSRALLIGDVLQGRYFRSLLDSVPPDYRFGSLAVVIPRHRIRWVDMTPEEVVLRTDLGPVHLPIVRGPGRPAALEVALLRLRRPTEAARTPRPEPAAPASGPSRPNLWDGRHLVNGRLVIRRRDVAAAREWRRWLERAGQGWRLLPRGAQWTITVIAFVWLQAHAEPAGVLFAVLMLVFLAATHPTAGGVRTRTPEAALAASDSIEARVAGAACRAWDETLREPSWSSPALAATRAAFDGDLEVDGIIDLALRIHAARQELGNQPTGPAAGVWQQQWDALDKAALRLGTRADALIRHRDQAAELSTELAQLGELERLERSAVVIDDLTMETAATAPRYGSSTVADQLAAARRVVAELVDLMNRTRAPLLDADGPAE